LSLSEAQTPYLRLALKIMTGIVYDPTFLFKEAFMMSKLNVDSVHSLIMRMCLS
jgi:hypothetical protein